MGDSSVMHSNGNPEKTRSTSFVYFFFMLLITKTCHCDKLIGNQFLAFVIGLFFISHEVAYN